MCGSPKKRRYLHKKNKSVLDLETKYPISILNKIPILHVFGGIVLLIGTLIIDRSRSYWRRVFITFPCMYYINIIAFKLNLTKLFDIKDLLWEFPNYKIVIMETAGISTVFLQ